MEIILCINSVKYNFKLFNFQRKMQKWLRILKTVPINFYIYDLF